jgi:hypothetical protein
MFTSERNILIIYVSWERAGGGDNAVPILDKVLHLVALVLRNVVLWPLEHVKVYFIRIWCVFQPEKPMYVSATSVLPLVSVPILIDSQ